MNRLICFGLGTVLLLQFQFSRFGHAYVRPVLDTEPKLIKASFYADSNRCFIIAGSFLIPQNAENQLKIIKIKDLRKHSSIIFHNLNIILSLLIRLMLVTQAIS